MKTVESTRVRLQKDQLASMVTKDRISNIPKPTAHGIISCLPARAAGRLSVLSKKWRYFFDTVQSVNFNLEEFKDENGNVLDSKIDQFMARYLSDENPHVLQRVKLISHCLLHPRVDTHVGNCLDLAIHGRIQELDLRFIHNEGVSSSCFKLPGMFFQSQVHLTILKLEGCHFGYNKFTGFPVLRVLFISYCHINDNILSSMVYACPTLENLILEGCYHLEKVCLTSSSIQRLVVRHCLNLRSICMNLSLLDTFECDASPENIGKAPWATFSEIEFATPMDIILQNLTTLYFSYLTLENATLQKIIEIFPNLSDLRMKYCCLGNGSLSTRGILNKLCMVDVQFPELIQIFASSLEFLHCESSTHHWGVTSYMPSGNVAYVCLASLTLGGFFISSEKAFELLISSCPLLENLNLRNCLCLRRVKISNQSLKTLIIEMESQQEGSEIETVEIEASNLISFEYDGPIIVFSHVVVSKELICLLRFSQLVEHVNDHQPLEVWDIVGRFKEATTLKLIVSSFEIFASSVGLPISSRFEWGHVKVKVNKTMCWPGVLSLVCISSCCTKLSIELMSTTIELKFEDPIHVNSSHDCIKYHLVEATFQNIEGNVDEVDLVKYVLLKAEHLKLMVITINSRLSAERTPLGSSTIMNEIKKIPYVSRKCEIVVLS